MSFDGTGTPAFVQYECPHHQVFVAEFRRVLFVRQDTADLRCQMEDHIRFVLIEQPANLGLFAQITFAVGRRHQSATGLLQQWNQVGPDKTGSARYEYFFVGPIIGGC